MPGRTPHQAVEKFIEPLRQALNVLEGYSQIRLSKGGGYVKDETYSWVLCPPDGMTLRGGDLGAFHAEMRFKIIDADPRKYEAPYRVTTLSYRYKLCDSDGETLWMFHWHPMGNSPYIEPHTHQTPDLSRHLPTGRITFEKVIAWCIEYGAETRGTKREAIDTLALCEAPHLLYRSWSDSPMQAPPPETVDA
jgi:hypothetical protein